MSLSWRSREKRTGYGRRRAACLVPHRRGREGPRPAARQWGRPSWCSPAAMRRPTLSAIRPDWRAAKFFAKVGYRMLGDDGLLSAIVKELEIEGFRLVGAHELLDARAVPEGPLGRLRPDADAEADIARGIELARAIGALDIGQAVVVQQGLVLGVEAIEGTDASVAALRAIAPRGPGRGARQGCEAGQERRDRPADDRRRKP